MPPAAALRAQAADAARRARREPAAVDMLARLPSAVDPGAVQERVSHAVTVRTKRAPHVALEEFDGADVVVRVVGGNGGSG